MLMNKTIFALGVFDGVHLGHQALLRECLALAQAHGCTPGAVTFTSHPDTLTHGYAPKLLTTNHDRKRLLETFGVARLVELPFDREMMAMPWEDFLTMLRRDHGAAGFVCGDDFRFGCRGEGTAALLEAYCTREGLPFTAVAQQELGGIRISSTHIRYLVESGNVAAAAMFLGHPHTFTGEVVHGRQFGRTIGTPTANMALPEELVRPRFGVYACRVHVDGATYLAVTNIGTRPTVSGVGVTIEPWLLDFDGDLYGKAMTLEFHAFLRPERKFDSLEQLQAEIQNNAAQTRKFFENM